VMTVDSAGKKDGRRFDRLCVSIVMCITANAIAIQ